MAGWRRLAIVGAAMLSVVSACASTGPPPTQPPPTIGPLVPAVLPGGDPRFARAVLTEPFVPRLGRTPDGPEMTTQPDGFPEKLDAGRKVVVLDDPRPGPGGMWVRVWLEENLEVSPSDLYAWLPLTHDGRDVLRVAAPIACPATATIESLAPLVQQDRLRCAGAPWSRSKRGPGGCRWRRCTTSTRPGTAAIKIR